MQAVGLDLVLLLVRQVAKEEAEMLEEVAALEMLEVLIQVAVEQEFILLPPLTMLGPEEVVLSFYGCRQQIIPQQLRERQLLRLTVLPLLLNLLVMEHTPVREP
jgi:hypothetical protein